MQIVKSKTDVYENFPNKIVNQLFPVLLLYVRWEVPVLTVLHDYVNPSFIDERIVVTNNEVWVEFS